VKIASIALARAIAFLEPDELNAKGKLRLFDVVPSVVKQFDFQSYPTKAEEFVLENGVKFGEGRVEGLVVNMLTLFPGIITVETRSSTDEGKSALENILTWGREELGLTYEIGAIRRWAYVSQVIFYTDFPILEAINPSLNRLAKKTGDFVDGLFEEGITYEVAKIAVGHDPLKRKTGIAPLSIEHRANTRFGDNKFFSEAPLPTSVHIKFLEELEEELLEAQGGRGKGKVRRATGAAHQG
jgi:hypothetical protein